MTWQPMAYDLRCAMMMFAGVECSFKPISMDWKRPENKDRNKMRYCDYCSDHQPCDCRSPT